MKIDKYNFFAFASNWLFLIAIVSPFAYTSAVSSIEEQKVEKFSKFHQYFIDQSNRFITNADFPYQNLYLKRFIMSQYQMVILNLILKYL